MVDDSNSRRTQFVSEPAGFREALLEAVDYGLMVLGEIVRQAIYERIEKDHGLKRTEIPGLKFSTRRLGACSA